MKRSCPARSSGPLGTSRTPVASTTSAPGCPSAKRAYHSTTSSVTMPSSVARHGTMAGTHVRVSSARRPTDSGVNHRARAASSRVGQRAGDGCLTNRAVATCVTNRGAVSAVRHAHIDTGMRLRGACAYGTSASSVGRDRAAIRACDQRQIDAIVSGKFKPKGSLQRLDLAVAQSSVTTTPAPAPAAAIGDADPRFLDPALDRTSIHPDEPIDRAELLAMYRAMRMARTFEQKLSALYRQGKIVGAVYLGMGQEAIATGVVSLLAEGDYFSTVARGLAGWFMRGVEPRHVMARWLGQGHPAGARTRARPVPRGSEAVRHGAVPQRIDGLVDPVRRRVRARVQVPQASRASMRR